MECRESCLDFSGSFLAPCSRFDELFLTVALPGRSSSIPCVRGRAEVKQGLRGDSVMDLKYVRVTWLWMGTSCPQNLSWVQRRGCELNVSREGGILEEWKRVPNRSRVVFPVRRESFLRASVFYLLVSPPWHLLDILVCVPRKSMLSWLLDE